MKTPKPVPKQVVCSECGLPWEKHTAGRKTAPTADVCLRLLKAELAARPRHSYFPSIQSTIATAQSGYSNTNFRVQ